MGLNGSGKSTLLKLVAGLLYPTRDQVRVLGEPPGRATKARMAYMSEADSLFPWMSVGETLAFILKSAEPLLDRPVVLAGGRILLPGRRGGAAPAPRAFGGAAGEGGPGMKAAYVRLLWKETREAVPAALLVVAAVAFWDGFLWSRMGRWFGPRQAVGLAALPALLLPLWAGWRLVDSLQRDLTGARAQLTLTLPLPGWTWTTAKLLVAWAEAVFHGLVMAMGVAVLAKATGGFSLAGLAALPADLAGAVRQSLIRFGWVALLAALAGLMAWLVVVQLAWVVGRLFRCGRRLASGAALVSGSWLVLRAGTVGPLLFGWLPRWTPLVWPDLAAYGQGPEVVAFKALTVDPAPLVAMGLAVLAAAAIAAWLLEHHLEA